MVVGHHSQMSYLGKHLFCGTRKRKCCLGWPYLWVEKKKIIKKNPPFFSNYISALLWVWGLNIHKPLWLGGNPEHLNWFQVCEPLRLLTKANSSLLWKEVLLSRVSENSYILSCKENEFNWKQSLNTQVNKPPWERQQKQTLESDLQRAQRSS